MKKYIKKPISIEACQFDGTKESANLLADWGGVIKNNGFTYDVIRFEFQENKDIHLKINTLEGVMTARKGDWIMKGINGEFYPCKDDIFQKSYDILTD